MWNIDDSSADDFHGSHRAWIKTGTYIATITAESVNINKTKDGEDVLTTAKAGSVFEVLEDLGNGWMKIRVMIQKVIFLFPEMQR